jgi:FKBP-type peptidyl-prolyl cis-trans isomerase 2
MQKGDLVYIHFVGKIKGTNEIVDVTREEIAKEANIWNERIKYGPVPVIVGGNYIIKGLDETLEKMEVGEKREVEIPPEKGFGERRNELIKPFPYSIFKENDIEPEVGKWISLSGLKGKIIKVEGGRVLIDFNHPLAGKTLVYEVEIVKKAETTKEKVEGIVKYFVDAEIEVHDEKVKIKGKIDERLKEFLVDQIFKWVKEIKEVEFVETYERKE